MDDLRLPERRGDHALPRGESLAPLVPAYASRDDIVKMHPVSIWEA
jgi:hypothetical protein